jgi:hypothetical protein
MCIPRPRLAFLSDKVVLMLIWLALNKLILRLTYLSLLVYQVANPRVSEFPSNPCL